LNGGGLSFSRPDQKHKAALKDEPTDSPASGKPMMPPLTIAAWSQQALSSTDNNLASQKGIEKPIIERFSVPALWDA